MYIDVVTEYCDYLLPFFFSYRSVKIYYGSMFVSIFLLQLRVVCSKAEKGEISVSSLVMVVNTNRFCFIFSL